MDSDVGVGHEGLDHSVDEELVAGEAPGDMALDRRDSPHGDGVSKPLTLLESLSHRAGVVKEAHKQVDLHLLDQAVIDQVSS